MWGFKKAETKYVPKGYLGDMSPEQDAIFKAFKTWITEEKKYKFNPWFCDSYLLRFCRARKFVLKDI